MDAVLSGASLQSLASAWMSPGPNGPPGVRRQLDFPAQGILRLQLWVQGGKEEALSISHSHPGRRHQLLNGKEDSCQQKKGGGVRRQIPQH